MGVRANTARLGRALLFEGIPSNYKFWIGVGANTTWTTTANWSGGQVPANNTTTDYAVFDQASAYTRQPAGGSNSVLGLRFTGAADVTFGSGITIGAGGIVVGAGAGAVSLVLTSTSTAQTWDVAAGKTITMVGSFGNGAGDITKTGTGTLTTAASTASSSYLGNLILSEGTFNLNNNNSPAYSWGSKLLQIYGGIIDNTSGAARTMNAGSATNGVQLLGDFQYGTAAGTSLNNLTITNGSGASSVKSGTLTITCLGGGTLNLSSVFAQNTAYMTGSLVKAGSGILNITTHNMDDITVNAGTLILSGNRNSSSVISVNNGATLQSGGVFNACAVNINAGGTLRTLTNSSSNVTAASTLTFTNSTSKLNVSVFGGSQTGRITATGAVALNSVTVDFDQNVGLVPGTYIILTATGSLTGSATKGVGPLGVATANWSLSVSGLNLRVIVV